MKRIGYFIGVVGVALVLMTSYALKTTFASSCCGTKEASAAEQADTKCLVCGKAVEKDKGVKVECEGKTIILCCKDCEAVFKRTLVNSVKMRNVRKERASLRRSITITNKSIVIKKAFLRG